MLRRSLFALIAIAVVGVYPIFGQEITSRPGEYKGSLEKRLREPISLSFKDTPLKDAINAIAIQSGVQVVPDTRALNESRVNMDAPVSGTVDNVAMKSALNILFEPLRLTWIIEDDAIKITTQPRGRRLSEKTYRVSDLVDPLPTLAGQEPRKSVENELMQLIQEKVGAGSWEDEIGSGAGTIKYDAAKKAIKVCHCQEVQEEVELLLMSLRKLQSLMVQVEVRFVHASPEFARRLLTEMDSNRSACQGRDSLAGLWADSRPAPKKSANQASMDDTSVGRCLDNAGLDGKVLTSAAYFYNGQRLAMHCVQMQIEAIEITVPVNGSAVMLELDNIKLATGEYKIKKETIRSQKEKVTGGWRYEIQPIVSPDRRTVRLNLKFENFVNEGSIERITKASDTFTVDDQRTLVWHLGESAGQHLFVLVRPRVIVREAPEEESIFLGNLQPIPGR